MCDYQSMPSTVDHPVAIRATAFIRSSRWLHRPVHLLRYDAYWADGRVDFDVSLSKTMYRGSPADFDVLEESVHDHCPEVGTGEWVGECGDVVAGPTQPEPNPPGNVRGTRWEYGVSNYDSYKKAHRKLRVGFVGFGVASLILGLYLLTGPSSDGFAGPVGVLCFIFGLSALSGFIPKKSRWW